MGASSEAKDDQEWLAQVKKNKGIIVSVDGIQQALGNETVYLVRDARQQARTGRRERDVVGDGGDESPACAGGGVGGERARDDHRCPRKRAPCGAGPVSRGAAS